LALGDVPNTLKYGRKALDLLPGDNYLKRGPAAALLGLAHWRNGDLEEAHQALADAMSGFQKSGNIIFAISGTYGLADIRTAQGRLREAISTYERSLQIAMAQGEPPIPGTADLYLGLSKLYREQGDVDAAEQNLLKSEALGEQAALADWPYRLRIAQARRMKIQGDLDGALNFLDEAERLYFTSPVPEPRPVSALKAQVWIAQDRISESLEWARTAGLSADGEISFLREFEFMVFARLLIAQYKIDGVDNDIRDALGLIVRLITAARDGNRQGSEIEILVLQAIGLEAKGDISAAVASLAQAMALSEPEGYAQIFVNEGAPIVRLLSEIAATGSMSAYAKKLLTLFETKEQKPADISVSASAKPLIDPLSKRELEILILIADGLKNKEIADELVISLNTVLYHIKNVYSKLGVNKRARAIAKAKQLKII
jgi:LuxR family maltose regulon positive regulatory protein